MRGGSVWLRATASCDASLRDPVVFVPKSYVALAAWIDGARVLDSSYEQARGMPWRTIALPAACHDVDVTLRAYSEYTQAGLPEPPRVGERAALVTALVPADLHRVALACIYLFVALVAGTLALGSRQRRALVGVAIYALALAGWTLFHTKTKQLWLPSMPFWFGVWWVSVPLVSTGVSVFLDAVFAGGPRRVFRFLAIALGATSLTALGSLVVPATFDALSAPIFLAGRGLSILGLIVVPVSLAIRARRGDRDAAILLAGVAISFVAVAHDFALSFGLVGGEATWAQAGYVALMLAFVLIVRRRVLGMQAQLVEYAATVERQAREREALLGDLHDGLGGIVTNVRLLAERGEREGDGLRMPTIARLASEGVAELRALLFGFDQLPRSWRHVAAELRRAGSTMLEGHGVEHTLEQDIAGDAPAPEVGTVLHLVRIHREALTNALKHANARSVRVRLVVRRDHLSLDVVDDGDGGGEAGGVDLGKGVASMRARAEQLGGELSIERDGGTRVSLTAPL
ncbi:MAG: hypothetical protein H6719_18215 [Sandaracinaceae bacterium]|nr:hypothetical protein [Sandaracinaceae bacterium]